MDSEYVLLLYVWYSIHLYFFKEKVAKGGDADPYQWKERLVLSGEILLPAIGGLQETLHCQDGPNRSKGTAWKKTAMAV